MSTTDITDALTAEEARIVNARFLDALDHFDKFLDAPRLVADLKAAAALAEDFAYGTRAAASRQSPLAPFVELIRSTERTVSPIEWAARLGVTASAIRMARNGRTFKEAA